MLTRLLLLRPPPLLCVRHSSALLHRMRMSVG